MEARLHRCREKAAPEEHLSDAEMKRDILAVDKRRAKYYGQFTGQEWGSKENFDLCINTTETNIKGIIPGLAELIRAF